MTRIMPARKFYGQTGQMHLLSLTLPPPALRPLVDGERLLGRYILPPFQRPRVWTPEQNVRLIESLYLGLPIGSIVWNQTEKNPVCDSWLLDGQQRMFAIYSYLASHYMVDGWYFSDLPDAEQAHFLRIPITDIETQIDSIEECRDIYQRLAYGGTPHEMPQ